MLLPWARIVNGRLQDFALPSVPMWSNQDPRELYGRRHIVILRPDEKGRLTRAGTGYADSKTGYYITTTFEEYPRIDAGMDWDPLWQWVEAPRKGA